MKVLKFNIGGVGATFTKPFSNTLFYTYSHIHKISVLGILASIIGIEKTNNIELPLFYKELNDLKISVVPKEVDFSSTFFEFTETSGFFNKEGSTYIAKYEMLINPSWEIYIEGSGNKYFNEIIRCLNESEYKYMPYLGKNYLNAYISDIEVLEGEYKEDVNKIDSLFIKGNSIVESLDDLEEDDIYFEDVFPISLNKETYLYEEEFMVLTNGYVNNIDKPILNCNNKNLYMI